MFVVIFPGRASWLMSDALIIISKCKVQIYQAVLQACFLIQWSFMSKRKLDEISVESKQAKASMPVVMHTRLADIDSFLCIAFECYIAPDRPSETITLVLDNFKFDLLCTYKKQYGRETCHIKIADHGGRMFDIVSTINSGHYGIIRSEVEIPIDNLDENLFFVVSHPFITLATPREFVVSTRVAKLETADGALSMPIFCHKLIAYSEYFEMLLSRSRDETPTLRLDLSDAGLRILHRYIESLQITALHAPPTIPEMLALLSFLHQCSDTVALDYLDHYLCDLMVLYKKDTDAIVALLQFLNVHSWAASTIASIKGFFPAPIIMDLYKRAFPGQDFDAFVFKVFLP